MAARQPSDEKGRARAARPFVCLTALLLGLAAAFPSTVAAAEALKPPILGKTNPVSPGASVAPRIQGEVEQVQTKAVMRPTAFAASPVGRGVEPTNTVKIYTDSACAGAVSAEGTLELLEGAGIQVTVAAESSTTFYATESDGVETSACSVQGLTYRQVSSAPAAPSFSAVSPPSPANNNSPLLIGSADQEATVSIYENATCTGSPVAIGSGAAFATPGIQVGVPNNSETTFYAKASLAGFASPCSTSSIAYQEVTPAVEEKPAGGGGGSSGEGTVSPSTPITPPVAPAAPHLRTVPGVRSNDTTPTITGTAPGGTTVLVYASATCAGQPVARGSVAQFASSGFPVGAAMNATSVFSAVAAVSGAQSPCSAAVSYVEDSLPPRTRITMAPAAKTAKRKAIVRFLDTTEDPPGTTFACRVGKGKWKQCRSPLVLRHLRPGTYTVQVRGTDIAGNVEKTGAKRRFRVVAHP